MEATMWGGVITCLQLQQTISCLRKLEELLEGPRENLAVPKGDQTRRLSISWEKEIASNLVFLLATTDESLKVMAVYVEEYYNSEGITIWIALNIRDISGVIQEFMTLAKILEQAARREDIETLFW